MTQTEINKYLKSLISKLTRVSNHRKILMTREWTKLAPASAGVYVIIENKKIVYVGESGNLRGRMTDLLDSRHHTVRRTIGKKHYSKVKGFRPANSKQKFPAHIEDLVRSISVNAVTCLIWKFQLAEKSWKSSYKWKLKLKMV